MVYTTRIGFGKSRFQRQKYIACLTKPYLQLTEALTETSTAIESFEPNSPFQNLHSLHNAIMNIVVIPGPTLDIQYQHVTQNNNVERMTSYVNYTVVLFLRATHILLHIYPNLLLVFLETNFNNE